MATQLQQGVAIGYCVFVSNPASITSHIKFLLFALLLGKIQSMSDVGPEEKIFT